ncbi:MAG: SAM-dependent chlorinase/fluorinase, partial [Bacteroidales bacterium]
MKNITLISDWKLKDPYVAMLKGKLVSNIPDVHIFDITHAIDLFNIEQTAFILKNSFTAFPEQSVHLILTGNSLSKNIFPVLVEYQNHYFIGEDSGIFSLMFGTKTPLKAWQYNSSDLSSDFPDKMIEMTKQLFNNKIKEIATEYTHFKRKIKLEPYYSSLEKKITGRIAYIDTFCNAVTDIPIAMFKEANQNNQFKATVSSTKHIQITKYHDFYNPQEEEVFFVFNRLGFLEIT